jgi:hypothetical protein
MCRVLNTGILRADIFKHGAKERKTKQQNTW